jgi:hypothetical protein
VISVFSNAHGLRLGRADFPKEDRVVVNMRVRITNESFLTANNFANPAVFELIAYSHESETVWRGIWAELVSKIADEIGQPVTVVK